MSASVAASAVKQEEHAMIDDSDRNVASSSSSSSRLPPYLPATTSKPADLPRAYLNGTQDMLSLFGLMPIYDRAVRPYNPETIKAENEASTSAARAGAAATSSGAAQSGTAATAAAAAITPGGPAGAGSVPPGATPSSSQQGQANSNATPRAGNASTLGAAATGLASHPSHAASSTGRISTPALQLNGGPPTFSLHTDSSAILAASPGQMAASAAAAPPARKPTKPPGTYAHYVEDLAGRVRPPRKSARAAREAKGTTLTSILFKPEYTPQRIVPFERETMQAAFSVEPGPVAEIDQALLEPDDEEARPRKKKKRVKEGAARGMQASSGVSSAARTPVRR